MNTKNLSPWLNDDESIKTDEELRVACKEWSPSTWEEYLKLQEKEQKELLFDTPSASDNFSQEDHNIFIKNTFDKNNYPELQKKIINIMRELSEKQQYVLRLLFWENLSANEISEKTGITRQGVSNLKNRALKQLGTLLVKSVVAPISNSEQIDTKTQSAPFTTFTKSL